MLLWAFNMKVGVKNTDFGTMPEDWELKKVREIAEVDPENLPSNTRHDLGIKYISLECVDNGRLLKTDELLFANAPSRARRVLRKNDLLFSTVRPNLKSHLHFRSTESGYIASTGFSVIRTSESPEYIYQHFWGNTVNRQVDNLISGSNYPSINSKDVKNLVIPLPPLPEQHAIAEALTDADAWVESLETLIEKKRLIKQGAIQKLLRPKDGWKLKKLGEIAEIRDGTHQTPAYVHNGIPFYSVESVTNNDFKNTKFISEEEHEVLTKTFKIEKGDILMTRIGSIGDCKLIDWEVNASFYVSLALLKVKPGFSANYLCHYSKTEKFKKEIEVNSLQSAIPKKINLGPISSVKIEFPPLAEQNRIATILSEMDSEIEVLKQKLVKARQTKQGMIQQLLTGKIRLVNSTNGKATKTSKRVTA